jgi:hypothetical protein
MHFGTFDKALLFSISALQLLIAGLLLKRGYSARFRVFLAYTCYSIAAELGLLVADHLENWHTYLKVYWAVQAVYTLLGLAAMDATFAEQYRLFYKSRLRLRLQVPATATVVLLLTIWFFVGGTPVRDTRLMTAFISFDLAADYMQATVFGLFVLAAVYWRPPWRQHTFGIMMGFGFFSIVGCLADLLRSIFGKGMSLFYSHAPAVAYLVACLIWLRAFAVKEPPQGPKKPVDADEVSAMLGRLIGVSKGINNANIYFCRVLCAVRPLIRICHRLSSIPIR